MRPSVSELERRVVDCHVHPTLDVRDCDAVLAVAARAGVDEVVLLGAVGQVGYDPTPAQIRQANDASLAWMRMRPDVCHGFCYLNAAHDPGFSREEAARCFAAGMVGVKLWISVEATDPRLDPICELAAARGFPVLHHAWYKTTGQQYHESTPADLAHLARRHPDTTIIMAHLTGAGQRGVAEVRDLPNVLIDTSGSQPSAGLLEYAVAELGADRVLFGSDAPGRDFAVAVERVRGAALSPRQKRLILGGNVGRLLARLTPEAAP